MAEITLSIVSNPNTKPEYLAKTKIIENSHNEKVFPNRITLDTYTREAWAVGAIDKTKWRTIALKSIDGKDKIRGFIKYLQERKKAMFGKLPSPSSSTSKAMFVVPYDCQPRSNDNIIVLRYVLDTNILKEPSKNQPQKQKLAQQTSASTATRKSSSSNGLLGNILGAQRRTDVCLSVVPTSKKEPEVKKSNDTGNLSSQEVTLQFRNKTESVLEEFNNNPNETTLKYPIVVSNIIKQVIEDEQDAVTEELLKYIVEEIVEDIGDDQWISIKEPSEFVDECIIAIYKHEKYAPAEVLDELNKGDIPEDMQNQLRAKLVAQNKAKEKLLQKQLLEQQKKRLTSTDDVVLNTNKRDRRTIEEIQRHKLSDSGDDEVKRSRLD